MASTAQWEPPPVVKVNAAEMLAALEGEDGDPAKARARRRRVVLAKRKGSLLDQLALDGDTGPDSAA